MKKRIFALLLALSLVLGQGTLSLADGNSTGKSPSNIETRSVTIELKDKDDKFLTQAQILAAEIKITDITSSEENQEMTPAFGNDSKNSKKGYLRIDTTKGTEKKFKIESKKYDLSKLEGYMPDGFTFADGVLTLTSTVDTNKVILKAEQKVKKHKLIVNFENIKNSAIKMKIDNAIVSDNYSADLEEGEYKISFEIPNNYKNVKVVPSLDPAKAATLKKADGVYTVDLKEDTSLTFVVQKTDLTFTMDEIAVGDTMFHGQLEKVETGTTYEPYVIYTDKENQVKQALGTVNGLGVIEFKDKVKPSLGDKLSFYVYDKTNQVYSDVITVEVGYKKLPVVIDKVYEGQSFITGKFDSNIFDAKKENVYFELYKVKSDGTKEEDPYTVFKQKPDNTIESVELFTVKTDKTFALNNKVRFTAGDHFVLVAKAGTEHKTELPFEVLEHGETKRVSGKNRYATALDTAKEAYEKTDHLILAYGEVAADALAAGPLANALDAPILLTGKDSLYTGIQNFIKTREVKNVIIVGGTGSVSNVVKNQLEDVKVERISGKDRFETAVEVAELLVKDHGFSKEHIIVANGYIDADALAVAPLATQEKQAILLTRKDLMPEVAQDFVKEQEVVKATIAGGKGTIDDDVVVKNELTIAERISGSNRYGTSLEIAKKLNDVKAAIFVNGFKSPDALTSAPLAKVKNAAILLVENPIAEKDNDPAIQYIKEKEIKKIYLAGGTSSLEEALETYFKNYVGDKEK
ncbi:MAG: cell wall-binding repeat-containing protein [Tissierellia bacterium]|nr:cell wall-binding repeat-containing protein [Tissierellia bacterium]